MVLLGMVVLQMMVASGDGGIGDDGDWGWWYWE